MGQMRNMPNEEAIVTTLLQNNPQLGAISTLLRNGNSLEGIAKMMAQTGGYDINQIINRLSS